MKTRLLTILVSIVLLAAACGEDTAVSAGDQAESATTIVCNIV